MSDHRYVTGGVYWSVSNVGHRVCGVRCPNVCANQRINGAKQHVLRFVANGVEGQRYANARVSR